MRESSIIVTGASRGLGRAIALALARLGARVTLNARSEDALREIKLTIEEAGGQAEILAGDVSHPDVVERLVARAVLAHGGIDGVINNAGVLNPVARIADSDPVEWHDNIRVNLIAPYLLTQAALPHLRRSGRGRVINISSGAAVRPVPGWSAYCVSKAGLNMFTAVLAAEEPELVALAVRPGRVDTAMQEVLREQAAGIIPDRVYREYVDYHRQGKLLPPALPGRALAVLALHAPRAWSGRFISWDDPEVQALVDRWLP